MIDDSVPWGRPPLPSVPVPPFADRDASLSFVTHLALYTAALDDVGTVGPTTFALSVLLEQERLRLGSGPHEPWPSGTVLRIAVTTFFPAPWTPAGLNDAIGRVLDREKGVTRTVSTTQLQWSRDPTFSAHRDDEGRWTVERLERGTAETYAHADNDDDMVLLRMADERGHPFPFGWAYDTSLLGSIEQAAAAARAAWRSGADRPSLTNWTDDVQHAAPGRPHET